jgi:hypothetical protein
MSWNVYFYQVCPICGRSLQVCVEYLGRMVLCRHCRGEFRATPMNDGDHASSESGRRPLPSTGGLLDPAPQKPCDVPQRTML